MKKITLVAIAILLSFSIFAQEKVLLKGKIKADSLQSSAIHIINLTQKTGTVNSEKGDFQLEVALNDELLFSSIQYQNTSVFITSEILEKEYLEVLLVEELNELEEVNISNIKLSGNLNTDVANIEIVKDMPVNFNYEEMYEKIYEEDLNDHQKAPKNLAYQQNQFFGGAGENFNIIGMARLVAQIVGLEKPNTRPTYKVPVVPNPVQLRKLFDDEFFKSSIGIQEEYIPDFINYLDENGLTVQMLKPENRLALIEYIMDSGERYKKMKSGID